MAIRAPSFSEYEAQLSGQEYKRRCEYSARHLSVLRGVSDAYKSADLLSYVPNKIRPLPIVSMCEHSFTKLKYVNTTGHLSVICALCELPEEDKDNVSGTENAGTARDPRQASTAGGTAGSKPATQINFNPNRNPNPGPRTIIAGELVAWRAWRYAELSNGGVRLQSVSMPDVWEPGKPMHGTPMDGLSGVHATKTRDYAKRQGGKVIGKVLLWGEVHEHEWGYRAQYAAVHEIESAYDKDNKRVSEPARLAALRQTYGVSDFSADLAPSDPSENAEETSISLGLGSSITGVAEMGTATYAPGTHHVLGRAPVTPMAHDPFNDRFLLGALAILIFTGIVAFIRFMSV